MAKNKAKTRSLFIPPFLLESQGMNNKKLALLAIVLIIILVGVGIFVASPKNIFDKDIQAGQETATEKALTTKDLMNSTFIISDTKVILQNGSEERALLPDSASEVVTKYFGNEVFTDINNDGKKDAVFLVTQNAGGSGTFFYAVGLVSTKFGYTGTKAILIGDRIAPQSTVAMSGGLVDINYADRKPTDPMTTQPSIGKTLTIKLDAKTMEFGEVVKNFEGEADTAKLSLGMKKWMWISTKYNNDTQVTPKKENVFGLTFNKDGKVNVSTDCNNMFGKYSTTTDKKITIGPLASTMMYCEGSQETVFAKQLAEVNSYTFTSKGELILEMKTDAGSIILR